MVISDNLICKKLVGKEYEYLNKYFTHKLRHGYVECRGAVLPEYFEEFANEIQELDVRSDDVWVISYPKSGTTWTEEMVWCISNSLNFEAAKEPLMTRFPFLENSIMFDFRQSELKRQNNNDAFYSISSVDYVNSMSSPRFIKTHLPFQLLPKKLQMNETKKIVYVMRNPADVCVSYYYHSKWFEGYKGGFDEFCELFLEGKVHYGPYWNHVFDFWNRRNDQNLLVIKYEDMKMDLKSVIHKVSDFLGKSVEAGKIDELLEHLSFDSMKKNPATNSDYIKNFALQCDITNETGEFVRSGKVGEWKTAMKPELRIRFENWIEDNLRNTDLRFDQ